MDKIKANPELLFEIIPSSKRKFIERKSIQKRLREDQEMQRKVLKIKNQIRTSHSPGEISKSAVSYSTESVPITHISKKYRPFTSGRRDIVKYKSGSRLIPPTKGSNNNQKLISNYMSRLTKDKILRLTDEEIVKYMTDLRQFTTSSETTHYTMLKENRDHINFSSTDRISSPQNSLKILGKQPKKGVSNTATQLASNLFSYYRNSAKSKKSQNS